MDISYDELESDAATDYAAQTPSPLLCSRGACNMQDPQAYAFSNEACTFPATQQVSSKSMTTTRAHGVNPVEATTTTDALPCRDRRYKLYDLEERLQEHNDTLSKLWKHGYDHQQKIEEQQQAGLALMGEILALKADMGATSKQDEEYGTSNPPVPDAEKEAKQLSTPTANQIAAAALPSTRPEDLSVLPFYPNRAGADPQGNTYDPQSQHILKSEDKVASARTQRTLSSDVDKVRATPPQTIGQVPASPEDRERELTPRSQPDSSLMGRGAPPVPQTSFPTRRAELPPPLVRDHVPSATVGAHVPSAPSNRPTRWAPWHQDKAKYMSGAYIYINLHLPAVGHDAGVLASLLEPEENHQSRFVPGNRMKESWYAKMQDAKQYGLDMVTTSASPTSGDYKMCVFHRVRLSAGQGEPLVHRRMAFAVLPDHLMNHEVEIVGHQREDGLKDADFAFEYCYANGAPRLALPNVRNMQERIGVHGRLAPSRARVNQVAEVTDRQSRLYFRNDTYGRPNTINPRIRSGPSDLAERPGKFQRR